MTELELLNEKNAPFLLQIDRSGVPVRFVEEVSYTIETAKYGNEHHLRGFCNAIRQDGQYVGILLIGQAIEDEADPAELKGRDYFRLIGFVIDRCCRGMGVGTEALKKALAAFDAVYGKSRCCSNAIGKTPARCGFIREWAFGTPIFCTMRITISSGIRAKAPCFGRGLSFSTFFYGKNP